MLYLLLTPAVLSLLVLGAHFLREGNVFLCVLHVGMVITLFFRRRPWVPGFMQAMLALGLVVWGFALAQFMRERQALGEPTGRLVVIMGSVIAVNLLAIALLGLRRVKAAYAGAAPVTAPGGTA